MTTISRDIDAKLHRRCPECRSTDIRERNTKLPRWKCGKCSHEFSEPEETIVEVQSFVASIGDFSRLNSPPSVLEVKSCAAKGNGRSSQLSILELDPFKIQSLLEGINASPSSRTKTNGQGGQGFGLSQAERKSVELRAMKIAIELYQSQGWDVIDMSKSRPYDLLAKRKGEQRFIEVKGTVGEGQTIVLTQGEVAHARLHANESALVVVSRIALSECEGSDRASGGEITTHADPWNIDATLLEATEYRYTVCSTNQEL